MRIQKTVLMLVTVLLIGGCSSPPAGDGRPTTAAAAPTSTTISSPLQTLPTAVGSASTPTPSPTPQQQTTYTVQRGLVELSATLQGRIVPILQTLSFAESGVLADVYVERGQPVRQGDLVAQLDLGDLPAQLRAAQAINSQDQAALDQAVQRGKLAIERAKIALDAAQDKLAKLQTPPKVDEIAQARADLQQAQANLETVRNNASKEKNDALQEMNLAVQLLEQAQRKYSEAKLKFDEKQEEDNRDALRDAEEALRLAEDRVRKAVIAYDTARGNEAAAVKNAEAQVSVAEAKLDKLMRGPDTFEIAEAEREVRLATVALQEAEQSARPDPGLSKSIATSRLEVQRIQEQIDKRRLYAPFNGEIAGIEVSPGMSVQGFSPVIAVTDPQRNELVVDTPPGSTEEVRLTVGTPVSIVFDRYRDKTISGVISRVSDVTPLPDGTLPPATYSIRFSAPDLQLSSGDSATVKALIGRRENVLWLPPQAIRTTRDRTFVFLLEGGNQRRVDIVIGLTTPERVEIRSGLKENDVVVSE